jgi:hypothetical protein
VPVATISGCWVLRRRRWLVVVFERAAHECARTGERNGEQDQVEKAIDQVHSWREPLLVHSLTSKKKTARAAPSKTLSTSNVDTTGSYPLLPVRSVPSATAVPRAAGLPAGW